MRSANAPRISAGVMIANITWNITKMYSGCDATGSVP